MDNKTTCNHIFDLAKKDYPIIKNTVLTFIDESHKFYDKYCGYSHIILQNNWKNSNDYRFCDIEPIEIFIGVQFENKDIKKESVVISLLHEIAHSTNQHYQIKNKKTFIDDYHGTNFYKHYADILRWAEEKKIFKLTYGGKQRFTQNNLQRVDAFGIKSIDIGEILL